ncbi:MAG: hypothetical protein IH965_06455 [Gemmatimonadetes bacterium]|nr:hypothetical protein [Gemmatimonadota bacterium]
MLTNPLSTGRQMRTPLSLRQEYEEFIAERIEDYKDQLSRPELLAIADEAVKELDAGPESQLVLTEVLMLDHVDRLIRRRLKLPPFRRWRQRHVQLRHAQRTLTHWGLPGRTPLADLAQRIEPDDRALVVGCAAAPAAYFLAAHGADVLVIDESLPAVESVETRAAAEALATRVQAMLVRLGHWFPEIRPALVVIHPGTLGTIDAPSRLKLTETLLERTVRGGVHLVLPMESPPHVRALAPEALQSQYKNWIVERGPRRGTSRWLLATKP